MISLHFANVCVMYVCVYVCNRITLESLERSKKKKRGKVRKCRCPSTSNCTEYNLIHLIYRGFHPFNHIRFSYHDNHIFLLLRLWINFLPSLTGDKIMFKARKIAEHVKDWIRTKSMNFFINRIITTINQQFILQVVHEFFTFVFFTFVSSLSILFRSTIHS